MRYRIPLVADANGDVNNPNNQALRDKYTAAFGDACYVSVSDTFDCFYQKWQDACADAVKIGEVSGNAPYMPGFPCVPDGVGNYTLQIGPDPANKIVINYQAAPLQTPDTDINGVATPVNGPYRNLVEVTPTAPGKDFIDDSGMVDADGGGLTQKAYILQVNMNANDGGIRSDLAGYRWPCVTDGGAMMCIEPEFLNSDPNHFLGDGRNVHHVVPAKDKRCCPWGTNSYANAAVISRTLNQYLSNDNPTRQEVIQLNDAGAYPP